MNERLTDLRILVVASFLMLTFPTTEAQQGDAPVIENGSNVALEYTLSLTDGSVVGSNVGEEPLTYTQGGKQILPALEEALIGMRAGDEKKVTLSADDGYGQVRDDAFREVPLEQIPEEARHVDALLSVPGRQGNIRVHEIRESTAVLDFNHPLAGEVLTFDIRIMSVE
ncbi:MAG: FKBP-type peptidyl-prolyl cis-trans isomerase [Arenicellales bacterium]|nr:FKBP-type peptidyl-prolyl cis-trans isomerase [Arenicellales bacterium]